MQKIARRARPSSLLKIAPIIPITAPRPNQILNPTHHSLIFSVPEHKIPLGNCVYKHHGRVFLIRCSNFTGSTSSIFIMVDSVGSRCPVSIWEIQAGVSPERLDSSAAVMSSEIRSVLRLDPNAVLPTRASGPQLANRVGDIARARLRMRSQSCFIGRL